MHTASFTAVEESVPWLRKKLCGKAWVYEVNFSYNYTDERINISHSSYLMWLAFEALTNIRYLHVAL